MKIFFNIFVSLLISNFVFGQPKTNSYKTNFSGTDKRVSIYCSNQSLEIVGISGNEVIIESLEDREELPAEAEGLKIVSPGGGIDNTGVGANVVIEGTSMKIKIPKSKYYGSYVVKVPKDVNIHLREYGNFAGKWLIRGMTSEVEAETSYSTLEINDVSGPIVARGGYGKLYITYDKLDQSRPNSISARGPVAVTLPADTKANIKVKATYADFFTDFDITPAEIAVAANSPKNNVPYTTYNNQRVYINGNAAYDRFGKKFSDDDYKKIIEIEASKKEKSTKIEPTDSDWDLAANKVFVEEFMKQPSTPRVTSVDNYSSSVDGSTTGTINGGGVNLTIRSDYGNVYLRKKK